MYISSVSFEEVRFPLKIPFRTALREATHTHSLYVYFICDNGIVGIGECTETIAITGECTHGQKYLITEVIVPYLKNKNLLEYELVIEELAKLLPNNYSAKAAVETAILDCVSKYYQIPLYQLLGGKKNSFETSVTVSLNNHEQMLLQSEQYIKEGFKILKLKFGHQVQQDIETFNYLVQQLPQETMFRIDANQGWTVKDTLKFMEKVRGFEGRIQFIEQPVHKTKIKDLKFIKDKSIIPIMADESVFTYYDAINILQLGAVDAINIKLMKCGGIIEAKKIAQLANFYDIPCMIGCMLETEIATSFALQLAMCHKNIKFVDLDAPMLSYSKLKLIEYKNGQLTTFF